MTNWLVKNELTPGSLIMWDYGVATPFVKTAKKIILVLSNVDGCFYFYRDGKISKQYDARALPAILISKI